METVVEAASFASGARERNELGTYKRPGDEAIKGMSSVFSFRWSQHSACPMMRIRLYIFILLTSSLQALCEATDLSRRARNVANETATQSSRTTGFTVEYTLITANSPDCEPYLVDSFPVRVQYRTIIGSDDGGQSNNSVSEWMDSPNMSGKLFSVWLFSYLASHNHHDVYVNFFWYRNW